MWYTRNQPGGSWSFIHISIFSSDLICSHSFYVAFRDCFALVTQQFWVQNFSGNTWGVPDESTGGLWNTWIVSGAGRRNNSMWKLSTLGLCQKSRVDTSVLFFMYFSALKMWPCTFLFLLRRSKWNISGVKKRLNFLFIKGIGKLVCGWKNGNEHSSHNCQCKYLYLCAVEISINNIIRKMFWIAYKAHQ